MTKLSLGLWGETVEETANLAGAAEQAGFWGVWAHELHRTTTVPLAAAAAQTRSIQLGSGIQLAFTRSALVTALTALDLDEYSGGRFNLGLGAGVRRLVEGWHSVPFGKPARHLSETIDAIRALEFHVPRGSPVQIDGEYQKLDVRGLHRPFRPARERIPIFVAAVGPMLSELAGRKADGWIGHELNNRDWIARTIMPAVDDGLRASGRTRADFTTVLTVLTVINRDRATAIRQAAKTVAFYATVRTYADFFAAAGFAEQAGEIGRLFRAGRVDAMIDAVPEDMVHAFALAGSPDEVRSKLKDYLDLADVINISPPHHFLEADEIRENTKALLELAGSQSG